MKDWRKALVRSGASIREVMSQIDQASVQIALVVDDAGHLIGAATDGDIRRGILAGRGLDDAVDSLMNRAPTTVQAGEDRDTMLGLMRAVQLRHVPVLDGATLVGLETLEELLLPQARDNVVVLMAGGRGLRLLPLTETMPKPMLPVGGRPILEHALIGLAEQGFRRFHFAVNYLGEKIEEHFQDGSRWGVSISYLREEQALGTAGALSLLPERPDKPFLVMNGDILTRLNFIQLMEAHEAGGCRATMCVRHWDYQIPFGVTRIEDDRLAGIEEKPTARHFINAGIYVVDPDFLDDVPPGQYLDMPQLLNRLLERREGVRVFPITEYWLDVGRHDDMQRALGEFGGRTQ